MNRKKLLRRVLAWTAGVLGLAIVLVGGYAAYLFIDYHRVGDGPLEIRHFADGQVQRGVPYTAVTYNMGFGAYRPEFSFFMDGGTQSRAVSAQSVIEGTRAMAAVARDAGADLVLLQEVDVKGTRSHGVDQAALVAEAFDGYDRVFCQNYDSSYLLAPLTCPHGANRSGMLTLSRFPVSEARRVELPVEAGFRKLLDLDRCYSKCRIPVSGGGELTVYTIHLSAYTADGKIATEQLRLLLEDMSKEYEAGNYVLCGGDFNKDLLGDSSEYFGIRSEGETWALPFPTQLIEGTPFGLHAPDHAPTCRNADAPYHPGQFVLTVDGFLVSDNVRVQRVQVAQAGFLYSDHNGVAVEFVLE